MDSFQITTHLSEADQKLLIIPEDCEAHSIFHVVKNEQEYCKLLYTEQNEWQLLSNTKIETAELTKLTLLIEQHLEGA